MPFSVWRFWCGILALLAGVCPAAAQRLALGGVLEDDATKEPLIGASVYAPGHGVGAVADAQGQFYIALDADTATLRFTYVGYQTVYRKYSHSQTDIRLRLEPAARQEIIIDQERDPERKVSRTQMSVEQLETTQAKLMPALFGEVDLLRVLQLKPGVQNAGEGSTGLYVRGGGPDQNLFLLDDATLYNPSHLFGFLSVFNADAVKSIELYKAAFPAQYGGRLSSVVDVRQREGNRDSLSVRGGVGLISSRLSVEGPIQKGKSSFILSARRTYFDVFTDAFNARQAPRQRNNPRYSPIPSYYFYDLNAKLTFELTPRDRLYVSGYYGNDHFKFSRRAFTFNFDWGNAAATVKLVHKHDRRMFSEASVSYTNYGYTIRNAFDQFSFKLGSGIQDVTGRLQWTRHTRSDHFITAGIQSTLHNFTVGRASASSADKNSAFSTGTYLLANEYGVYLSDKFSPTPRLEVIGGVRLSGFTTEKTMYSGLEPRATARYQLTDKVALKAGYARTYQYLHLVSSSGSSLPTDVWYPSGSIVKPQVADQISGGYHASLWGNRYFFSHEAYYKRMDRQVDFKDGANLFVNGRLDTTFVFGKGWSYGSEFYLEKKTGRTTGWIGYTLSWTWRQFDAINRGAAFHPRYDQRHNLSIVVIHRVSPRLSLSATFVYGSGNAVTLPTSRTYVQDLNGTVANPPGVNVVPLIAQRSNYRMAAYHRADVAAVWQVGRRRVNDLTFSIYNVYSRMNPYFIYIDTKTQNPDGTGKITGYEARQVSLFPIIPSITYNFKF